MIQSIGALPVPRGITAVGPMEPSPIQRHGAIALPLVGACSNLDRLSTFIDHLKKSVKPGQPPAGSCIPIDHGMTAGGPRRPRHLPYQNG